MSLQMARPGRMSASLSCEANSLHVAPIWPALMARRPANVRMPSATAHYPSSSMPWICQCGSRAIPIPSTRCWAMFIRLALVCQTASHPPPCVLTPGTIQLMMGSCAVFQTSTWARVSSVTRQRTRPSSRAERSTCCRYARRTKVALNLVLQTYPCTCTHPSLPNGLILLAYMR